MWLYPILKSICEQRSQVVQMSSTGGRREEVGEVGVPLLGGRECATWSETPPVLQPVFCGSSLQDTSWCQTAVLGAPRAVLV